MMYADELRVNSIVLAEMEEERQEQESSGITITTSDEAGNPITITYTK